MKSVVKVIAGLLIAFVLGALVICAVRPVGRKPVIPVIVPPRADSTPAVIGGDDEELVVRIPIRIPVPGNYVPGRDTVRDTLVVTVKKRRVTVKPVEIVENPVVMVRPPAVIAFSPALYVGAAYPIGVTVKDCQGFRVSAGVYARVIRVWKFGVGGLCFGSIG